jgi:hypothetical protein
MTGTPFRRTDASPADWPCATDVLRTSTPLIAKPAVLRSICRLTES